MTSVPKTTYNTRVKSCDARSSNPLPMTAHNDFQGIVGTKEDGAYESRDETMKTSCHSCIKPVTSHKNQKKKHSYKNQAQRKRKRKRKRNGWSKSSSKLCMAVKTSCLTNVFLLTSRLVSDDYVDEKRRFNFVNHLRCSRSIVSCYQSPTVAIAMMT